MKSVKVLFVSLSLVLAVVACSPSDEDVTPDQNNQQVEKFDIRSDETGPGLPKGGEE